MRESLQPTASFRREDYAPASHAITAVQLTFRLHLDVTKVRADIQFTSNSGEPEDLILAGDGLEFQAAWLDGEPLLAGDIDVGPNHFKCPQLKAGTLSIETLVYPNRNTELMGLYASQSGLYTQCESEGFRRITYFLDRPDVLSIYTVVLEAPVDLFPTLLSNGNLVEDTCHNGIRRCVWHDPFPKPSYLFALVAANLQSIDTTVMSQSGQPKLLQVYTQAADLSRANFALESLRRAMQWDERRFGLELDLERFMIVAVPDFNSGAMENKGLNLFNTKYVLADPDTATDRDFELVEAVIGHEYFHNWTGNRITCRDWFQLTLKEGLTVFRDQEFSADMLAEGLTPEQALSSRAVKRIEDVRTLRAHQFPEDAGPMAHPIRPAQYQEIRNFYTATVYEKGAEVIRMLQTMLGRVGFEKGMRLYIERHDGRAATCEDFVSSILDANDRQDWFEPFMRWYDTLGTPRIQVEDHWNPETAELRLRIRQRIDARSQQQAPLIMPIGFGLLSAQRPGTAVEGVPAVLILDDLEKDFSFHIPSEKGGQKPWLSLLRDFSAPVILERDFDAKAVAHAVQHESDPFNRWDACQQLMMASLLPSPLVEIDAVADVLETVLVHPDLSDAFKALALSIPSDAVVAEAWAQMHAPVDPSQIRSRSLALQACLAASWEPLWKALDDRLDDPSAQEPYQPNALGAGQRSLRHLAQTMASIQAPQPSRSDRLLQRFHQASNMTSRMAALTALISLGGPQADEALEAFANRYQSNALVLDKWFTVQVSTPRMADPQANEVLDRVQTLLQSDRFDRANPNRVRALLGAFFMQSLAGLHRPDGQGYALWADELAKLDRLNAQLTSRLARSLDRWRVFEPKRRAQMQAAIERLYATPGLSPDTAEVCQRFLESE
jgi:aminopeptidase N